jgi:hypothetical protein
MAADIIHAIVNNIVVQIVFFLAVLGAIGVTPLIIWLMVVEATEPSPHA